MSTQLSEGKPPRILLVDDNEMNRSLVQLMLEKTPYSCKEAIDGAAAVSALQKESFDIVFMDCQMPGMDGFETTQLIRNIKLEVQPYIIAMTANPLNGDLDRYLSAGMDDYLSKPISYEGFLKMIEKYREKLPRDQQETDSQRDPWQGMDFMEEGLEEFKVRNGFDDAIAKKLYMDYVRQLPKMVEQMELALTEDNMEELARLAHQLKGSSGMLRIGKMADICLMLEMAGKNRDRDEAPEILKKIKWLFEL